MMKLEREAEDVLASEMKAIGLSVFHMNTTVDGFPDLFVAGDKAILIEMKYDRLVGKEPLSQLLESSQPVFMHNLAKSRFFGIYLCAYNGRIYSVYSTIGILPSSMSGKLLCDLPVLYSGSACEVAGYFADECYGGL